MRATNTPPASGRRLGISLLELTIATATLGVVLASGLGVHLSTLDTYDSLRTRVLVESEGYDAIEKVTDRLRASGFDTITPPPAPGAVESTIEFTRANDLVGGVPTWEAPERIELIESPADPADGIDNDGNGLVDECHVVWIREVGTAAEKSMTLARHVREAAPGEVLGNLVDDNGNGLVDEPGLTFVFGEEEVGVLLWLERRTPDGHMVPVALSSTVFFRNTTAP
jgi:hypothetical protein